MKKKEDIITEMRNTIDKQQIMIEEQQTLLQTLVQTVETQVKDMRIMNKRHEDIVDILKSLHSWMNDIPSKK